MKTKTLKTMCRIVTVTALCALGLTAARADEWYVDHFNGDDSYDGKTPQTAKKTIQAAVDCAKRNDTVKVAEGTYEDVNTYGDVSACVVISNHLTLVATGSKDRTHIIGRHADTSTGIGEGAVRCVYVKDKVNARIEGFTIRDGAADDKGYGGGVAFAVYDSEKNIERGWLVDCVVSNCVAERGGAMLYGTAIRCLFSGNNSSSYGKVASQSVLYNCLVVGNVGSNRLFNYPRAVVNCTIAGNKMNNFTYSSGAHYVYNTIFLENSSQTFHNSNAVVSNCLISTVTTSFNRTASGLCATNDTGMCFVAPAFGDWRARSDSGAAGLGDATHLTLVDLPEESMRYVDFAGNEIPSSGAITCGAIQETVTPSSGVMELDGSFVLDGLGVADSAYCNYLHATDYPCMFKMKAADATISNIVWYSCSTGLSIRVPTLDGWVGVMPPPSGKMTIKPVYASKIIYADAENGDDGYEGDDIGSWEHPYKTLQAAYEAGVTGSGNERPGYSVICAKPGDYDEGGKGSEVIDRRLNIHNAGYRRVRVVALEGPDVTFIRGAAATESALPCSCVYMDVPSVVQGFTLTGGHSVLTDEDENASTSGAALSCALTVTDRIIADCVVSNNVSQISAQRSGLSLRCVFLDNEITTPGGGDLRNGYTAYSVFRTGAASHNDAYALGSGSKVYFSTYKGRLHANADVSGDLAVSAACNFIDASTGDYRIGSYSSALGAGDEDPENYWKFANLDMAGNTPCFMEGCPTAGAYQWPSGVTLALNAGKGALDVSGAGPLTNALLPGTSVTLTKAEGCGRNLLGFELPDGTFADTESFTYAAPSVFVPGQLDVVSAVFSTNWYVNAGASGDDSNDGFTPETPKKTLEGVMAAAVMSGDTVHAAPGEYAEGGMYHEKDAGPGDGDPVIESRVVVPAGVTLVADEGADVTHIVGAPASSEHDMQFGLGSNAVRCAFLYAGAKLKGFTLRDGHTNSNPGKQEDCAFGGGVLGVSSLESLVEDCVISNCTAMYGGAGYSAYFRRCRFFHNHGVERSSVTRVSRHESCIADWNRGGRPFDYFSLMTNCTIGAHQMDADGNVGKGFCLFNPVDTGKLCVFDCLVLGKISANVKMYRTAALSTSGAKAENCTDCIFTNIEALAVNEDYRPIIGENVAIDVIPLSEEAETVRDETDVYGVQRVFNGARDLGALDADWRPRYAKTLGGRGITVAAADPSVTEADGAVRIPEGSLELSWRTPEDRLLTHFMGLAVTGDGTLSVGKDGMPLAEVTGETSGVHRFRASGTAAMSFAFAPGDSAEEYAEIGGFSAPIGTMVSIR